MDAENLWGNMNNYLKYIVFLLICVLSRVISSIYYIEDPESLRFALCVFDPFDFHSLQSTFPGAPIFCFVAKIFYTLFGNFSLVFSIIGGISVFIIIVSVLKLLRVPLLSLEGGLVSILIFFNPMIWLMSNKYMPDLTGVAIMIAAFSFLVPDSYKNKDLFKGWFLTGILMGIKLSFLPFLIIPCIYTLTVKKKYLHSITFFVLGVLFWLVPLLMNLGKENISEFAQHATNYLFDVEGTVFVQNDYWLRFIRLVQSIWADGLGGYWIDRNSALLFTSTGMILCFFFGFLIILSFGYSRSKILVVCGSIFFYSLYVYFFQNIIYNSKQLLPVIPFSLILISYGIIYFLVNFNYMYVKVMTLAFLLGNIFITIVLTVQHTELTAIAKAKEYIVSNRQTDQEITIVSIPLINDFLSSQNVKANYISVHPDSASSYSGKINSITSGKIVMIGNFTALLNKKPTNVVHFQHNPYVNRIWTEIHLYEYYLSQ